MNWWAADDDAQETVFRCVDVLTGKVVNLEEVDRGNQSTAGGIRSTQPRGEAGDDVRSRLGANPTDDGASIIRILPAQHC
jgi:hypothetical protein